MGSTQNAWLPFYSLNQRVFNMQRQQRSNSCIGANIHSSPRQNRVSPSFDIQLIPSRGFVEGHQYVASNRSVPGITLWQNSTQTESVAQTPLNGSNVYLSTTPYPTRFYRGSVPDAKKRTNSQWSISFDYTVLPCYINRRLDHRLE